MDNLYYTYAYLREDGTPYYIGKGKGNRAYSNKNRKLKVPPKDRILLLKKDLPEEEAFRHEIYMIAVLGRKDLGTGILRNLTNGGEGTSGFRRPCSEETRAKISAAKKGMPVPHSFSEETRAKISERNRRRVITKETRAKIGEANKRRVISEETRAKLRKPRGKRHRSGYFLEN
jgi:hypothetical protein